MVNVTIDGIGVSVPEGTTILNAAQQARIYIPRLCHHPDLSPVHELKPAEAVYRGDEKITNRRPDLVYDGCQICVVEIEGTKNLSRACCTSVEQNMVIKTVSPELDAFRQDRIMFFLAKHPHACLNCAQKEGCGLVPCSMGIPEKERCCPKFGRCEFQKLCEYIGIRPDTPRYIFEDLPFAKEDPLFERNYNLCVGCSRCVRACKELRGADALDFVFDDEGRMVPGTVKPSLKDSGCRFCTACVEVCPTGALTGKMVSDTVPSRDAYPVGVDAPRFAKLTGKAVLPPEKRLWVEMSLERIEAVPEKEGVYQLLDGNENVIFIKGAMNLKHELKDQLELCRAARFFMYQVDEMYGKRESELLQQYMAEHGRMPQVNQELDDLF